MGNFFFERKVPLCRKNDSLVSPGMVCYAEKEGKPFWFSSLGQMMQLETIKNCRTILVTSCGLEKKVTIIVAFHFMKRRLKNGNYISPVLYLLSFIHFMVLIKVGVQVILKKPEEFKIRCLSDIRSLFPETENPLYAGFGNKNTDTMSYSAVGIPNSRIFIINHRGWFASSSYLGIRAIEIVFDLFVISPNNCIVCKILLRVEIQRETQQVLCYQLSYV